MSINDLLPSKTTGVSNVIAQYRGMSNGRRDSHARPISRSVSSSPQISGGRSFNPTIARPDTTISAPSVFTVQSVPHRAWEAGYQSPFARIPNNPLDPLYDDTPSEYFSHHTDLPSNILRETRDIYPRLATVNAPVPTPSSNPPASPLAMDTTILQHPERAPQIITSNSYRPRIRKVVTKEITLDDIDIFAMVTLGMSPFMVGQDMIANQNRFVRNECVFARQFVRLQRATADADAHHSQTERDIYQHLEQHKASLDKLASGSGSATLAPETHSARTDPDFLALEMAHQETCARLEALSRQVMEYSQSTQRTLMDMAQRIDQIIRTGDYSTNPDDFPRSRATATPPSLSPLLLSTYHSNVKRKRNSSSDSILESPRTMPPPTPDFRSHHLSRV